MKKIALAHAFVWTLFFSAILSVHSIPKAEANFVTCAEVKITSPANKTYNLHSLVLDYTVNFSMTGHKLLVYSVDGGANVTLLEKQTAPQWVLETYSGQAVLPELPDGTHRLDVYACRSYLGDNSTIGSAHVYFTVDTKPPEISDISVENKEFESTNVTLSFWVDEEVASVSYSVDNQTAVTIEGNTTIAGLTEGSHTIIVSAVDDAGNSMSKQFSFSVRLPKPNSETETEPDLFALTVSVSVGIATVIAAAMVVYLKKRKR